MSEGRIQTLYGKVYYKRVGTKDKTPMLCLHGGPGSTSDYLSELEALGNEREVIFYDQSGSGRSCNIPASRYTIKHYTQEIDIVRNELDLDSIILFGHSWGGMLAVEYLTNEPRKVRGAILASPVVSTQAWIDDISSSLRTLPDGYGEALLANRPKRLLARAHRLYLDKYHPHGDKKGHYESSKRFNEKIYLTMWGSSEFACNGTLKGYDATDALLRVPIPVLFTTGTFDGMLPKSARKLAAQMPDAEASSFRRAGHYAHNDFPKRYVARVRKFLRDRDV